MSSLFKSDVPDAKAPPSKDDERSRRAALKAKEALGGRGTTLLTKGLATPAVQPAGATPPKTLATG